MHLRHDARPRAARAWRFLARVAAARRDDAVSMRSRVDELPEVPPPEPLRGGDGYAARLAHLETELEAVQDQVYRQAQRHDRELAALRRQPQPGNVARALSADARRRGV